MDPGSWFYLCQKVIYVLPTKYRKYDGVNKQLIVKEGKNILLNEKKVCQKYLKFGVRM